MIDEGLVEPSYFTDHGYHCETLERLRAISTPPQRAVLRSVALVLVKPDAFASGKAVQIVDFLTANGLHPVYALPYLLPRLSAFEQLYMYNLSIDNPLNMAGSWWLNSRVYLMGPSLLLLVASADRPPPSVHQRLAAVKGASDPLRAAPGSLRRCLRATNRSLNLIHTADDPLSTAREFAILFGWETLGRVLGELSRAGSPLVRPDQPNADVRRSIDDGIELCRAAESDLTLLRVLCRLKLLLSHVGRDELPGETVSRLRERYTRARTAAVQTPEEEVETVRALLSDERALLAGTAGARGPCGRWLRLLAGPALVGPELGVDMLAVLHAAGAQPTPWDEIVFLTGLLNWMP